MPIAAFGEPADTGIVRAVARKRTGTVRPRVRAYPIVARNLPKSVIGPPIGDELLTSAGGAHGRAWELAIDSDRSSGVDAWGGAVLRVSRYQWGTAYVDGRHAIVGLDARGEPFGGVDARYLVGVRPVRWEGLIRHQGATKDGDIEYEVSDGWLDTSTAIATVLRRTHVPIATIIPERLFAFRQCDDEACKVPTTTLVAPGVMQTVSIDSAHRVAVASSEARIVLPADKGVAHTYVLEAHLDTEMTIEVQQTTTDAAPTITAFVNATSLDVE